MNKLGGIPFNNNWWNGPQIILWFALFSFLIISLALINVKLIKILAIKWKWNSNFVGGVVLSLFTSLPELVTGFYAGISDRQSNLTTINSSVFSLFNILGANSLQMLIIMVISLYLWTSWWLTIWHNRKKLPKTNRFSTKFVPHYQNTISQIVKNNYLMWFITVSEYLMMGIVLTFPAIGQQLTFCGFSLLNLLFFIIWLSYLLYSYFYDESTDHFYEPEMINTFWWKIKSSYLLIIILLNMVVFTFCGYLNGAIVDQFPQVLNIPQNFASTFLLSLVTSMPEIVIFTALLRKKLFVTAACGILGSSVFNLSIPFYTNLITWNSVYGQNPVTKNNGDLGKLGPSVVWSLILYLLVGLASCYYCRKKPLLSLNLVFIVIIVYFTGLSWISQLQINNI